ncbi:MAG: hypothetical protein K0R39_1620 [Symbiobacteriaceae bacterium]|jgi:hypothetical protein|nr:hypothetical protein [Symbiobacteriaceae bacterium]
MIITLRPDDVERFLAGEEVFAMPSQIQDNVATYSLIVDLDEIERELEVGFFMGQRFKVRLKR